MPPILIGLAMLLLAFALVFGFLNTSRLRGLREELARSTTAREISDRARARTEKKLKSRESDFAAAQSQATAAAAKASSAEEALSKAQNAKAELEAKLEASEGQIADLQKRVAEATMGGEPGAAEGASANEMKAMLVEAREQLEAAEQEKSVLADKMKAAQDRVVAMEEEKRRRGSGASSRGVHGTVLAVNQAYNFVVLSMGDRQGVVPNSEMLVLRAGAFIGKIRISSVEPTTSIGDIISNSLARGVQVQPGDTVIYAGSTNS